MSRLLTADGVHDIGLCFPALGCIEHLTQTFTAALRELTPGVPSLGGLSYDWGDASGLDFLHVNDQENTLRIHARRLLSINTIVGKITVSPEFRYNTFLKAVRSPYGDPTKRTGRTSWSRRAMM